MEGADLDHVVVDILHVLLDGLAGDHALPHVHLRPRQLLKLRLGLLVLSKGALCARVPQLSTARAPDMTMEPM